MSYKPGQWLAICDRCGFRFLSSQLKLTWDGLRVDKDCWEPRHEQDFVRGVKESTIPWSRPEPEDIEIGLLEYVADMYWDRPAVMPPASATTDKYVLTSAGI